MIEYIRGSVEELTPTTAIVEASGVGYCLNITLNTYTAIQGHRDVKLYVWEAIREDAHVLYGFATKRERELYALLISVSGVGAASARVMLSSLSPKELCDAIATSDERVIKACKGIGPKTAARVIVDLKDKIAALGVTDEIPAGGSMAAPVDRQVRDEAVSAMTMLGFPPAPSAKVVTEILQRKPDAEVQDVIKEALKIIKS